MSDPLEMFVQVLATERDAIAQFHEQAGEQATAIRAICTTIRDHTGGDTRGRLVVTGVGKAGLIGRKLAATFASTGTPSFFLHPAEARHGDLGMVREDDLVLALSNSGSSEEVLALLPSLERIGCVIIALTGRADSPLAAHAQHRLVIGDVPEACPLGLAPSSSTTTLLAAGDGIALAVQALRSFSKEDYARFHPGGALGRKLMTCSEAMRPRSQVASVSPTASVREALQAITASRSGCAVLLDTKQVVGLFSDGDLRRSLAGHGPGVLEAAVADHGSVPCSTIRGDELLQAALHLFASRHFDELPVVDDNGHLIGLIDVQDLAHRGFEV